MILFNLVSLKIGMILKLFKFIFDNKPTANI